MRGILRMVPSSYGGSYNPLTTAWITATGESDVTILNALSVFEAGLTTYDLLGNMKRIYPFVGGSSIKHSYNFLDTSIGQKTDYGGVTNDGNGKTFNGSSGYSDSNSTGDDLFPDYSNISFGFYSRTDAQGVMGDIGTSGGDDDLNIYSWALNGSYFRTANTGGQTVAQTTSLGFFVANRISSTEIRCLANGNVVSQLINKTTTTSARNMLLGKSWANYSSRNYSFEFYGTGLTDAKLLNLNTLVQDLQTALGRQV